MPLITKRLLDAITPDGKLRIIADDDLTGFGVQVTPAGQISFCVDYRVNGKRRRKVIGRYGPVTADTARKLALKHLGTASGGEDPLPDFTADVSTIDALFDAWMARHVEVHLKPKSARYYQDVYAAQCRHRFGKLSPKQLSFAAVADAHAKLKTKPVIANRMLSTLRAMLFWAEDQRLIRFTSLQGEGTRPHPLGPGDQNLHHRAAASLDGQRHPPRPHARVAARSARRRGRKHAQR